jgi:hypothetical protein
MRYALSAAVLSLLFLTILSLGCNDSDDNEVSGTTFDAVGIGRPGTPPGGSPGPGEALNIDGVWRASTTITSNGCGSRVPSLAGEQVIDISQSDTILNATVFSPCGATLTTGVGTINGSAVSLNFTHNILVSPNCTLRIQTIQSGSVENANLNVISGTTRFTVSGTGNCGSGLPCQATANLLMQRCPPASCTFQGCP